MDLLLDFNYKKYFIKLNQQIQNMAIKIQQFQVIVGVEDLVLQNLDLVILQAQGIIIINKMELVQEEFNLQVGI